MKILALDTATLTAGAAVLVDGELRAAARRRVTTHSEMLLALVDEVLRAAGVEPRALDGVACGAGPGSFTGLRIGLATAKGLCFAHGRPLVLVSSLAALAARAPDGKVAAILDAHKDEVYVGLYEVRAHVPSLLAPEAVLPPARLVTELAAHVPLALVGDGVLRYRDLVIEGTRLVDEDGSPDPADVARLGAARLARGEQDDLARAAPAYIRASEAELVRRALRAPDAALSLTVEPKTGR